MTKEIDIEVSQVLFPRQGEDGGFYVLLTDQGKASGKMKWRPEPGERLTLQGKWGAYRGERNFNFETALPNVPVSSFDQLSYVCERTKGVGPGMRDAIWEFAGADWREIEVGDVKGFTQAKANAYRETIHLMDTEKEKSAAIAWLMSKGASVNMATSAFEMWGKETIGVVQANCFRLAELEHFSFVHVDGSIRENFGIEDGDIRRINAAILYKLRQLTGSGSTVIDWIELKNAVCHLVGGFRSKQICDEVSRMFEDGSLKGFTGTKRIAMGADYFNELMILNWIEAERSEA